MTTRLLFVDDEPFVREVIRRLLTRRRPEWELPCHGGLRVVHHRQALVLITLLGTLSGV